MKTYCNDCKVFFSGITKVGVFPRACHAPQNGKPNWRDSGEITEDPEVINQNNDCKWFVLKKRRWW